MKEKKAALFNGKKSMIFKATEKQRKYLDEGTYEIISPGGKNYQRAMELIAYNMLSRNMLVKEKVSFNGQNYEKIYVLSDEGKTEKYRGKNL